MAATPHDVVRIAIEETPRYEFAPETGEFEISTDVYDLPVQSLLLNGAPGHMDRSDEVRGSEGGPPMAIDTYEPAGSLAMRAYVNALPWLLEVGGWEGTVEAGAGTNETQTLTITGTPTGGTFTISWTAPAVGSVEKTTRAIPYNATAAQVQEALERTFGRGNFECSGGPLPGTPVVVKFIGNYAAQNAGLATTTDSLTGGTTPASAIVETVAGAAGAVVDPDGLGVPSGAYLWTFEKRGGIQAASLDVLACYVNSGIFLRGQGFGLASLGLNAQGIISAELAGLVVDEIDDPELTPALDAASILPARRGDLILDWLEGGGTLSDFSIALSNPLVRQHTMGLAQSTFFPDKLEHGDEKVRVSGSIPKHSVTTVDWQTLMRADTFAARARWKLVGQNIGSSGAPHAIHLVMPACQYISGGIDPITNRRRTGGSFDWWAAHDDSAGYDAKLYVVCGIDSIRGGIS